MKHFALVTLAAFALLVPAVASAQGLQFVYRPELRAVVAVPPATAETATPAAARSAAEEIARHEAMGHAYRGTRIAQAAVHCDRAITEARKQF
jgi:hypothetical protein